MKNDKNKKQVKGKRSIGRKVKLTLQFILFFILLTIVIGIFYFYRTYGKTILQLQSDAKEKVSASSAETFKSSQTSLVYDVEGNLISTLKSEKDAYYIEYESIPKIAIDAMVESEDRKFFEHDGVDYLANVRAAIELIKHKGNITQGASTITQQLARNIFLTQEVTYQRKIEEIFVAQEMERKYTKAEIMEFYLNGIYFANGHYGIQAAAQGYFGKGVSALSISQIAFLCAIPNNPNLYNPENHFDNTIKRRDRILDQLLEGGKIDTTEYNEAKTETIVLQQSKSDKKNYVETYTYYSAIRALMKQQGFEFQYQFDSEAEKEAYEKEYDELYYSYQKDLYIHGYRIYTSIDLEKQQLLQKEVNEALEDFTEVNDEGIYQMQGAAVCIDNDSGRVVAIVGGREQEVQGYTLNRGYQSYRQPGSSIKPLIVYTPIFEREYTPASIVNDEYIKDGPKNSEGSYSGKIKLQKAIEKSKNTIAWKLFQELTPETGLAYLHEMNFARITDQDYTLASALGGFTIGASPVEMAAAYATLENDGFYREPTCIVKIMDSEGNEIVGEQQEAKKIYEANAARIMTEALTGVIKKGTGKGLGLTNTISAGKTGTTDDRKDGWFVGYTPYYTTSVWVGYDLPKYVEDLKGSSYPGEVWHNFMEQLHTPAMKEDFLYYDWRAELKKAQEEEKKKKEQEEELKEQEKEETSEGNEADPVSQEKEISEENTDSENNEDENTDVEDSDSDTTEIDTTEIDTTETDTTEIDSVETDTTDTDNAGDNSLDNSEDIIEPEGAEEENAEENTEEEATEEEVTEAVTYEAGTSVNAE